jgi:DNA-binding transcriptional LysR family regulator
MLDPRRLLTFREVARQRSFSRAAAALSLTQPAVSQQVRALEVQLGERLIERGRGRFALTAAGELLLAHADAVQERLELAETQLGETASAARRLLRVGAFPSIMATLVPAAIAQLEGAPEVRRHDVLDEPMVAALGPRHRLTRRRRIRLADLADDTWTAATRDGLISRACVAAGFEPRIAYLTADPLAIRSLVVAGLTVTLTPRLLAPQLVGVSTPALTGDPVQRTIYAVVPPTAPHPLAAPFLAGLRR